MPLKHPPIFLLNRKFTKLNNYDPGALLDRLGSSRTILEVATALNLAEEAKLDQAQLQELLEFVDQMPDSLDVAIVAALRQALADGHWVQITWQPGYDWELRAWSVTGLQGEEGGVLNLFIISPNPDRPSTQS